MVFILIFIHLNRKYQSWDIEFQSEKMKTFKQFCRSVYIKGVKKFPGTLPPATAHAVFTKIRTLLDRNYFLLMSAKVKLSHIHTWMKIQTFCGLNEASISIIGSSVKNLFDLSLSPPLAQKSNIHFLQLLHQTTIYL